MPYAVQYPGRVGSEVAMDRTSSWMIFLLDRWYIVDEEHVTLAWAARKVGQDANTVSTT